MSFVSWAIRYAASLDGIITVLSDMNNIKQMEDNLSYMKDFQPLTDAEQKVIKKVQTVLTEDKSIPAPPAGTVWKSTQGYPRP